MADWYRSRAFCFRLTTHIPAGFLDQLQNRSLCVKRIHQEDVEKTGSIQIWQTTKQSKCRRVLAFSRPRSEEHTSELQSLAYLVCRLLLEKKKKKTYETNY